MQYTTRYDVGDRKRTDGINEDSVAVDVFEQGHRDGYRAQRSGNGDDGSDTRAAEGECDADAETRSAAAFALADGAGGHAAGDVASYIATTVICEHLAPIAIRGARSDPVPFGVDAETSIPETLGAADLQAAVGEAIQAAHRDVLRYAREAETEAYTTAVAGICVGGDVHYGWVGDSRAYVVNGARESIELLTKDHAVVEELQDSGDVDDVEARVHPRGHEITRALGGTGRTDPDGASVDVDTNTVPLYAEDVLLVASDGLVDAQTDAPRLYDRYVQSGRSDDVADEIRGAVVTDAEIRDHVLTADSLDEAASALVELANSRGGKDNLSVLCCHDPTLAPTPEDRPLARALDPSDPLEERDTVIISE